MAKRKGKGLGKGLLQVVSLVIDDRLKVGALMWLSDKYDIPADEVMKTFKAGSMKDIINLIIALAIQHDPLKTEVEVRGVVGQLELDELGVIASSLTSTLVSDAKNSKRPAEVKLQE